MKIDLKIPSRPRIEMLPLIDVVFLLLVVFIYAMLSMAVHKGMPVALPESSTVRPETETAVSVTIAEDRRIYINRHPVRLDRLAETLASKVITENTGTVLLFADKSIRYQYLFNVLDRIRAAGPDRISLQAEPE